MAKDSNNSTAPKTKKPGRIKQMIEVYKQTQAADRSTGAWMLAALLAPILIFSLLLWLIFKAPFYGAFIGLAIGVLLALLVLARKAQRAVYTQIEDQPGAALAVMQQIPRGWNVEREPAAFNARSKSMLFRASGRAGIALVAEGFTNVNRNLMEKEVKRLTRMFPNVPIHEIYIGRSEDEVPLPKLTGYMTRMKPKLTRAEAAEVSKRLNAMPSPVRQAIPKGVDPMRARPNRKALRGR